jgi:endoglucanase
LAATDLLPLAVEGRRLVARGDSRPVLLRGVNRSGLEYAQPSATRDFLDAASLSEDDIDTIVRGWGANVIRVPFNQDFVLSGRAGRSGDEYLAALDRLVTWAAARGAYTLLDLQWIDADTPRGVGQDGSINRVPALPNADSVEVWRRLASHYRDAPSVLFDLFNEPHDPLFDDLTPLEGVREDGAIVRLPSRSVGMAEWQPWAQLLIRTIRDARPDAVIFVSGVAWAFDLRGFPLRDGRGAPLANLVYSTHVYPWCRTGLVRLRSHEAEWTAAFGRLAETEAVFVGEWGGTGERRGAHLAWGRRLEGYLRERGIGWAAWSWADWPFLVADCRACNYEPTAFGAIVKDALRT